MRILLKFVVDCDLQTAWLALRKPAIFRSVAFPLMTFESLETGGFPEVWPPGPHPVTARAFGVLPAGTQLIDLSFEERADGVLMVHDDGGPRGGALTAVKEWHHTMAVSPTAEGATLYRDRLTFSARPITLLVWPVLWAFWQWRGARIRGLLGNSRISGGGYPAGEPPHGDRHDKSAGGSSVTPA